MIQTAIKMIQTREDDIPSLLLEARNLLRDAVDDTESDQTYTLLAEAVFWLGEYATEKTEKEAYYGEGVDYGKQAVAQQPESVAANLWYAANMGAHGLARGIMSSLFYLSPIDKHGKKALDLDETFFFGAPLRLMGRYYHQAPGWPIGKGHLGKAIRLLEKAVKVGPNFLLNHLYLAEAYIARRKKAEARKLLDYIAAAQVDEFPIYQSMQKALASELGTKV